MFLNQKTIQITLHSSLRHKQSMLIIKIVKIAASDNFEIKKKSITKVEGKEIKP